MGTFSFLYAQEKPLKHVKLIMEWYPSAADSYTQFLIAIDKGYYKEENLEVELVPSAGSGISTKLVANKESDFGSADATTTLIARTKGAPLVVLAAINQSTSVGVYSLKSANIRNPKDLIGKKIATELTSKKHNQFLGFLKKQNIDPDKITFVPITGGGELNIMLSGVADATLGMVTQATPALKKLGKDFNVLLFKDYGVNIYDRSIITHEDMLKNNPEVVRGFLRATLKGVQYAIDHREEASEIYLKHYPNEMDREKVLMMLEGIPLLTKNEVTKKYGIGYQIQERWEATQNFVFEGGLIDKKIDVKEIYTNEFR